MNTVEYSNVLKNKAESYIVRCFEDHKFGIEAHNLLIQTAMIIIQGAGWVQEQQFVVEDPEAMLADAVGGQTIQSEEELEIEED